MLHTYSNSHLPEGTKCRRKNRLSSTFIKKKKGRINVTESYWWGHMLPLFPLPLIQFQFRQPLWLYNGHTGGKLAFHNS